MWAEGGELVHLCINFVLVTLIDLHISLSVHLHTNLQPRIIIMKTLWML